MNEQSKADNDRNAGPNPEDARKNHTASCWVAHWKCVTTWTLQSFFGGKLISRSRRLNAGANDRAGDQRQTSPDPEHDNNKKHSNLLIASW